MPNMDRTGPFGTGPIGRGLGPCGGGQAGFGRGRGFIRGGGRGWAPTSGLISPEEERTLLDQQKNWLEQQLAAISQRLQEIKK